MKLARTIVLLAGLVAGLSVWGQEPTPVVAERFLLASITNNYDPRITELWISVDDIGHAVALERVDVASRRVKTFGILDLAKGVVLMEEGGHDIFILQSTEFDPSRGGHLDLSYLYNGLTGSRKSVRLESEASAEGWRLLHSGAEFKKIYVLAHKILGKVVGVKELRFSSKLKPLMTHAKLY